MAYQQNDRQKDRQQQGQQVAIVERLAPLRMPVAPSVLATLDLDENAMRVIQDQLYPTAKSIESIALALAYCRSRNLDIMKKPVHIVPVYSSALKRMVETVWPGIAEIRTTATRTGSYAGIDEAEFGPIIDAEFKQVIDDDRDPRNNREIITKVSYPEWCRLTCYRIVQGQRYAFSARVFWREAYATAGRNTDMPNEMWRRRIHGQLEKCTEAAVLRKAFPEELGGVYAAEEMEGRVIEGTLAPNSYADIPEPRARQRPAPPPSDKPTEKVIDGETVDQRGNVEDADELDPWNGDDNAYLDELRDRLAEAPDLRAVGEVWQSFAPEQRFDKRPLDLEIAGKIRAHRERALGTGEVA